MNLVLTDSVLWDEHAAPRRLRTEWIGELPWLNRWHHIYLWLKGEAGFSSMPETDRTAFQGIAGVWGQSETGAVSLRQNLASIGLSPDETALVGNSRETAQAARDASIQYWVLAGSADADAGQWLEVENIFRNVPELMLAALKSAAAEHKLFPITTVGGLLRDEAGEALFVRTRKWSNLWGIPGGKVEYGETLAAAFRREMREETGLEVGRCELVMAQDSIESPEFFRPRHFVLLNYLGAVMGRKPPVRLNHESLDYLWAPLEEAVKLPVNGPTRLLLNKVREGAGSLWTV